MIVTFGAAPDTSFRRLGPVIGVAPAAARLRPQRGVDGHGRAGGSGGNRTLNTPLKRRELCHLSYGSLVDLEGVEPSTSRFRGERSAIELQVCCTFLSAITLPEAHLGCTFDHACGHTSTVVRRHTSAGARGGMLAPSSNTLRAVSFRGAMPPVRTLEPDP